MSTFVDPKYRATVIDMLKKAFVEKTGYTHAFQLRKNLADWLALDDGYFDPKSPLLLPDARAAAGDRLDGLALLAIVLCHGSSNTSHQLLITAHTDGAGDDKGKLAKERVAIVTHLLLGEQDPFVKVAKDRSTPAQRHHLLTWAANWLCWPCALADPDHADAAQSKAALKAFQAAYSQAKFGEKLEEDAFGPKTWAALYKLYQRRLAELCGVKDDELAKLRGKLRWHAKRQVLCAEKHPLSGAGAQVKGDGVAGASDGRIEFVFFTSQDEPKLKCHASDKCEADKCDLYNPNVETHARVQAVMHYLTRVDSVFAAGKETQDITYKTFLSAKKKLTLRVRNFEGKLVYERPLSDDEKSDGAHTIRWDGKGNQGDFKDHHVHPLDSPYTVELAGDKDVDRRPFQLLYHSLRLHQGPWTPDEVAPPKDSKEWVQHRLNELGYYGGPVGKDSEDYLKKAVIRYKFNHKKLHKLTYSDYNDALTPDLLAALAAGDNPQVSLDTSLGDPFADEHAEAKIYVEALTYEAGEFGATKRWQKEKERLNRPLLPIEVEILLRGKDGSAVSAPLGVGPARISWRFRDSDEDLTPLPVSSPTEPSQTKRYVEKALKLSGGRSGDGDNCHKDRAGLREAAASTYATPVFLGEPYVPYKVEKDDANKVVFSTACVDAVKYGKRVGRAGLLFRPSYIAGDDYQITAEIDFSGRKNQKELEATHGVTTKDKRVHVKSGRFQIWRRNQIAMVVHWPARTNAHQWAEISAEFEPAYNDVKAAPVSKNISDVLSAAVYKDIVAANTVHTDKTKISLLADSLVGVTLPTQGNLNAADFKRKVKRYVHDDFNSRIRGRLREELSKSIRADHPGGFIIVEFLVHRPINVETDPGNNNHAVTAANTGFVTWAGSIGMADSVIFADQKDPDKVYYVVAHEMGHNFWLEHWENIENNGGNPADHDQADHNCTMSYSDDSGVHPHQGLGSYTPHFCGKCNLKLRGWDINHASMPADST